jgi:hypothetical protein
MIRYLVLYNIALRAFGGIVQWYGAGYVFDDRSFESRQGLGIFLFTTASRPTLEPTQTPIYYLPGAFSLGVKRLGREADNSPPSRTEIKNAGNYTSTPQYASWRGAQLNKHRVNFTLTLRILIS